MREKTVLLQGAMEEECACFLKHMKEPEETVIDVYKRQRVCIP